VDVRWRDQGHRDELLRQIRGVAAEANQPGCRSEVTVLNERGAWPLLEGTERLAEVVQAIGRDLGQTLGVEHRKGTSDSNFFGSAGVPTVDGLGPICEGYHTPDELVYVSSIAQRTALLACSLPAVSRKFGNEPVSGRTSP
jgi:glutamate carboxypeptidase